jgi:outer membrane protein
MRKLMLAAALAATGSLQAAPLIDIYGGIYTGYTSLSGDLGAGSGSVDLENELGFDSGRQTVIYLGLEHPVPVLPNARLRFSTLSDTANGEIQNTITFGGETINANTLVTSRFDLDYTDLTLYYTPLDLAVKLDIGLTARQLKGDFVIQEQGNPSVRGEASVSEVIPMLHVGAYGKLPLTGFYATGEINAIGYSGDSFTDVRVGIGWVSDFLLGVELGYGQLAVDFDLDDVQADMKVGGPYLAFSLNF